MTTHTHSGENRLRRLAETLTTPDPHIPPAARAGIDAAELKRAVALFRAVIFDGYFDPRPLDVRLTELAGILARQSARALATFRRGTTSDTVPAAGTSPSNAPTAGAVADTTPAAGTSPDNASGAAARRPKGSLPSCPSCAAGSAPTSGRSSTATPRPPATRK